MGQQLLVKTKTFKIFLLSFACSLRLSSAWTDPERQYKIKSCISIRSKLLRLAADVIREIEGRPK